MSGGQLSGGKNITIPLLHFYVLHSKCKIVFSILNFIKTGIGQQMLIECLN